MIRRAQSARAAGAVSLAVFLSRILGVVREQVFARFFGAGIYNDAWLVAFRIPNLLRDLFAEGALSSAFVPTFTGHLRQKGLSEAWLLANLVFSGLLMVLGTITLILVTFPTFFVLLLGAGFAEVPGKIEITASLTRILSPFLMLVTMASVAMGVLNALNHFFIPALAPALFNAALILSGFFLAPQFKEWGIEPIFAMAVGALIGGFLQYGVQVPLLRRHGYRFRFLIDFHHEGVRRMAQLMAPAVVGISALQINIVVTTFIASFLRDNGPISWLNYAFRIVYLPIGLFGVAVGTVNLREVSVSAAEQEWEDLKETVAHSVKLVSLLAVPSMVGLILLSRPIVKVLFERGEFTHGDTLSTANALTFYSLGLLAYCLVKIYGPTFYALDDTRTPVRISVTAVVTNIITNLILVWTLPSGYQYLGLACGTAFSVSLNAILLARGFRKKVGSLGRYHVSMTIVKMVTSAAVMGLLVFFLHHLLEGRWEEMGFPGEVSALLVSVCVGIGVYFWCCRLFRIQEVNYLFDRLHL